jgi:hypothetical protein
VPEKSSSVLLPSKALIFRVTIAFVAGNTPSAIEILMIFWDSSRDSIFSDNFPVLPSGREKVQMRVAPTPLP